jgi:eukaryotic-like serine/threonine-protein kinase
VLPASAPMTPVRGTHHDPTYVPTAGPSAAPALAVRHYAGAGASLDTATRPGQPVRHARKAARRPGPPVKVAVPVLLLALVCFAVGFWALTRI